jgi:glycosyltransferase involved in cell wall biosynthesis
VGSIGYRYRLDAIGRLLAVAARGGAPVRLRVISPGSFAEIATVFDAEGVSRALWSVEKLPHRAVPAELARQDAGLVFLNVGLSAPGGSSTKVGEYWASGLPVVASPDVADVDAVIRSEKVGVVVEGNRDEDYARALEELRQLLRDPEIRDRCRRAAARHFAIGTACDRQVSLYRFLAGDRESVPARQAS